MESFSRLFGKSSKKAGGSPSSTGAAEQAAVAAAEDEGFTLVGGKRAEEAAEWFGGGSGQQQQQTYPALPGQETSAALPYALGGSQAQQAGYPSATLASQVRLSSYVPSCN